MENLDQLNQNITELIVSYLKGLTSEKEVNSIKEWLSLSEDNRRYFDEVCDIWAASASYGEKVSFDAFSALQQVKSKLNLSGPDKGRIKVSKPKRLLNTTFKVFRIAAVFIFAFLLGLFVYRKNEAVNKFTAQKTSTEFVVPMGSKSQVFLPDGTKVWLNAGSKLRYGSEFNTNKREVYLEGEAFFDVKKKQGVPFLVNTADIVIRVMGTAFNVKAYPNEGSVQTTLVRGSLIVERHLKNKVEDKAVLSPHQRATFIEDNKNLYLSDTEVQTLKTEKIDNMSKIKGTILLSKKVDTDEFTSWKDNRLVFRNEEFGSLVLKLERWYGVKITISDSEIRQYHFNGIIENETIQDVMEIIRYTLPIKYVIDHNQVIIQKANV